MATLQILPLNNIQKEIVYLISSVLTQTYNLLVNILPKADIPKESFNPSRNQYLADKILEFLRKKFSNRVFAITAADLYAKGLNFIFGQAELGGRAAVVSIYRLNPEFYGLPANKTLFFERIEKEAIHEIGHLFGLGHCSDRRCVMSFSNSILEVDQKTRELCKKCIKLLHV